MKHPEIFKNIFIIFKTIAHQKFITFHANASANANEQQNNESANDE